MTNSEKYLIVKGAGGGGIGDRLRCVLSGIAYAKLTGRVLYVDWSDGKLVHDSRNVFNELFELKNIQSVQDCPQFDDVYPLAWKGRLNESLHKLYTEFDPHGWDRKAALKQFSFDQSCLDYSNQVLVMWDFDQFSQIASALNQKSSLDFACQLAGEHIAASPSIAEQVNEFFSQNFLVNEKVIAAHIRATTEFDEIKSSVQIYQYIKAIKRHTNYSADKIFLATDNSSVEEIINQKFPGIVKTRKKWFAQPGERIHFNDDCPDPEAALVDAAVEMFLLARSDFLIYQQNSSFGMAAHILSLASKQNITPLFAKPSLMSQVGKKLSGFRGPN